MDALTIALIVLALVVVALVAFAIIRRKQRSGSVLASPASVRKSGRST
ncbi:MAG: hypothetical protein ABIP17_06375 [Ilumatobacteraceae bacterium]